VRRTMMLCAVLPLVVAVACGPAPDGGTDALGEVIVLAKAEGWRPGLQDATGFTFVLVEVAADASVASVAWADNVPPSLPVGQGLPAVPGVYGEFDSVDFDRQAVVVYSSGESGTCPAWVTDLSASDGRLAVTLASTAEAGQPCTDDFRPYRLVLAVDRDRLPEMSDLPLDRIDLVSENVTEVEGLVVAYPYSG
jgi:hypothetical protein